MAVNNEPKEKHGGGAKEREMKTCQAGPLEFKITIGQSTMNNNHFL